MKSLISAFILSGLVALSASAMPGTPTTSASAGCCGTQCCQKDCCKTGCTCADCAACCGAACKCCK